MADHVVVDASLTVGLVTPLPYSRAAAARFRALVEAGAEMLAPALWAHEVCSALRKGVAAHVLSADEAEAGLARLMRLGINLVPPDADLLLSALRWAGVTGEAVANDAAYLALAEKWDCELWTADCRLARIARAAGADWVRSIEPEIR